MKWSLFLAVILFFGACTITSQKDAIEVNDTASVKTKPDTASTYISSFTDKALEQKITDTLLKLSFVAKSSKYIDSFSNHQHGIAFIMDEPQENEPDISVQAGYNGGERFETYYRFFVEVKTMEIKVYDPVEDKKLTIKEYLKSQR